MTSIRSGKKLDLENPTSSREIGLFWITNRKAMPVSCLELEFDSLWESLYPDMDLETEVLLIPGRRYRFDYAHIEAKVAIELNGQIWRVGGHSSGAGLQRDYEKLNLAQSLGWCVFQLSSEMIDEVWLSRIVATIRDRV